MKPIGIGKNRQVFILDKTRVVKIDKSNGLTNALEYKIWLQIKGTKWEQFFAPCLKLHPNGHLIMARVQQKNGKYPLKKPFNMPVFLKDIKIQNFGIYEDRPVVCDYTGLLEIKDEYILINPKETYCNLCKIKIKRPFFNSERYLCKNCFLTQNRRNPFSLDGG